MSWSVRSVGASPGRCWRRRSPRCAEPERDELLGGPAAPARAVVRRRCSGRRAPSEAGFAILHALYWLACGWRSASRCCWSSTTRTGPTSRRCAFSCTCWAVLVRSADRGAGPAARARQATAGLLDAARGRSRDPGARCCPRSGAAAVAELVRGRLGGRRRLLSALFRADRGQPAAVARAAGGDRAAGAIRPTRRRWRRRAELAARSLERSVLRRPRRVSRRRAALARAVAVFEDDAPAAAGGRARGGRASGRALAAADELARADLLRAGDPLGLHASAGARGASTASLPFGARGRRRTARAARLLADAGAPGERVSAHLLESPPPGDEGVVVGLLRGRGAARAGPGRAGVRGRLSRARAARAARDQERAARARRAGARRGGRRATGGRVASRGRDRARWPTPRSAPALLLEFGRVLAPRRPPDRRQRVVSARARRARTQADASTTSWRVDLEGGYLTAAMLAPGPRR